jgi:16S rRNA (guanine966-N2)-methyltransferase
MTRIIAGRARGRRLAVPARGTRPTSDRVRESLFSSLDAELLAEATPWSGIIVLDLYAGSGALGLEALSRGARSAAFVESDRAAARVLLANCAGLGLPGADVLQRRVESLSGVNPPSASANLVFADPPYERDAADIAGQLQALFDAGWISRGARVVVERPSREETSPLPASWRSERQRRFGDTCLWYGRAVSPGEEAD